MKSAFKIFILFYYSLVTLFLPMGGFLTLKDIPKMYQSYKENEHHNIRLLDFITDHLIITDGFLYKHNNEEEQKPQKDFHFTHRHLVNFYVQEFKNFEIKKLNFIEKNISIISNYKKSFYIFSINHFIYRPPIIA
jgi:hypothetical protein